MIFTQPLKRNTIHQKKLNSVYVINQTIYTAFSVVTRKENKLCCGNSVRRSLLSHNIPLQIIYRTLFFLQVSYPDISFGYFL